MYSHYFKVGGKLKYNHPSYVERKGDRQLLSLLQAGEYCLVLNSRQMGKSSLQARTAKKLRGVGVKTALIDLTLLGNEIKDEEKRVKGFADELVTRLNLEVEFSFKHWWQEHQYLPPIARLNKLIERVLLVKIEQPIVIFIDEIDSLLKIDSHQKDDFFAFIRACYNKKADDPAYERLAFCLLGVISPSDLAADQNRTPFNIGRSIDLTGLTFEEAKTALVPGLATVLDQAEAALKQIIAWTGGQPFLTQKLCTLVVQHAQNGQAQIDAIVQHHIINNWENQDVPEHLRTIEKRLITDETKTVGLLGLYQQILAGETVVADQSEVQTQLRLSGLVVKRDNHLEVYNPIYQTIFNSCWVEQQLENLRPYSQAINLWLESNRAEQYLLSGEKLNQAQTWAKSRNLSPVDYQFLSESQRVLERKVLEADNRRKRIVARVAIALTTIIGLFSFGYVQHKNYQAEINHINRINNTASEEFDSGQELQGLTTAVVAAQRLQQLVEQKPLSKYPTTEPLAALNNMINTIRQTHRVQISGGVSTLAFTADGEAILIGSNDGNVRVWHQTTKDLTQLNRLPGKIIKIYSSQDGQTLFVASEGGAIQRWQIDGTPIDTIVEDGITSFDVSPDGTTIVWGDTQGNITLKNLQDNTMVKRSAHGGTDVNNVVFSPDGEMIASSGNDVTLKLWTKTGELIADLTGHDKLIDDIVFSQDSKILVSGSSDRTIRFWNLDGSQWKEPIYIDSTSVTSLALAPNRSIIANGGLTGIIDLRLFNSSMAETGQLKTRLTRHPAEITDIAFSRDVKIMASGDRSGQLQLWHYQQPTTRVEAAAIDPQYNFWLSSGQPNSQLTVQTFDGERLPPLPPIPNKLINSLAVSPRGDFVVAGTEDGLLTQLPLSGENNRNWTAVEAGEYQGKIIDLDFDSEGNFIAVGVDYRQSNDRKTVYQVKLWDASGSLQQTVNLAAQNQQQAVTAISFADRADKFIVARANGEIELWDTGGELVKTIVELDSEVVISHNIIDIAVSRNGNRLATANAEGVITIRSSDGTPIVIFEHSQKIISLDFSSDGQQLLAIDQFGSISTWHLQIDAALQRGCQWLQDYAQSQTEFPDELCQR